MSSRLQIIPEQAYMEFFRGIVDEYLSEVTTAFQGLLSSTAEEGLEKAFWRAAALIAGDTLDQMSRKVMARDTLFPVYDLRLYPKKKKEEAAFIIKRMLENKEQVLSETLYRFIRSRFRLLADAFSEMLRNIICHRAAIKDALFDGQDFTCIHNISAGAGDYHNFARAAAIIETDRGKMVYKPRNCLTDVRIRVFAQKYFPDSVYIPKCYTDGSSFGVCEYLSADQALGAADPRQWFYALGGLTVLILLLGSSDMHYENIISFAGIPAIIDLETILTPRMKAVYGSRSSQERNPRFVDEIRLSIWPSALLSGEIKGMYRGAFRADYFTGLEAAYRRCLARKAELEKDVKKLFSDVQIRMVMRNTQNYGDLMTQLYKAGTLFSEEACADFSSRLEKALMYDSDKGAYRSINRAEAASVLRGDIPYFYTYGNSYDVFSNEVRYSRMIQETGIESSLQRIGRMSEQELQFEKKLIKEVMETAYVKIPDDSRNFSAAKDKEIPARSSEVLSMDDAVQEAGLIMKEICRRMIKAPNGTCGWVGCHGQDHSSEIMPVGMFTGTTGIGVFAAAMACTKGPEEVHEAARACEQTAVYDLEQALESLKGSSREELADVFSDNLGEASGIAGLLRCLSLMNRYSGRERYRDLIEQSLDILELTDISAITDTDRIQGLSGIISVLCDYPELHRTRQGQFLISAFADRLLELKQFQADGFQLWKTASERHIISGAGHGMAGIGAALYAAGSLLHDRRFLYAALEALDYEEQIYSEKLGTWPDNRSWPAQSYMHGYCSGAPGIGIMMHRIKEGLCRQEPDIAYRAAEVCDKCADLAERSAACLPLLYRDHLCCGNSAIAEYYLATGKREEAGRILHSIHLRKGKTGTYITTHPGYHNSTDLSLFYGITGIGYEMLRYAFPEKVLSLI